MVKFILPLLALPFGEGVTPFVSAHRFKGGALNTQKGIHLRNIANRHAGQIQIGIANPNPNLYSNQVHYLDATAPTGNDHYFGYWFENCDNLEVDNNIALSNTVPLGNGIDKRFRGFSVDNTTNSNFCSNKAEQMGSGVWVYNKCAGTQFHGTTNSNCFHGFHLVNADLPPQGYASNSWGNAWYRLGGNNNDIVGNTNGNLFDWFHQTGLAVGDPFNPYISAFGVTPNISSATSTDCIAPPQAPPSPDDKRKEMFGAAATDTTEYDNFPAENRYMDKEAFYKAAKNDSTILELGLPDDSVFANAFDSISNTNVGTFYEVEKEIKNENLTTALALNQTISPAQNIEANTKLSNEIYFHFKTDSLSLFQSQYGSPANYIADQNAIEGGLNVYIMRAILNKDVVDDPVGYYRKAGSQAPPVMKQTFSGRMYPNPAGDYIMYAYVLEEEKAQLVITDALGKSITSYDLLKNNTEIRINTSQLPPGIYCYKVSAINILSHQGRFTIIK